MEIARQKEKQETPLYDPSREQKIFLHIDNINPGPLENTHLHNIYREIMSATIAIEGSLKVAYLGPKGSFTHQAALKKFGSNLEMKSMNNINSVFKGIIKNEVKYGVLPIENSTRGKISSTIDVFMDYDLNIYSEVHLTVHHNLVTFEKDLDKIKEVYTHLQARDQSQRWLSKNLPQAKIIETQFYF